MTGKKQDDFVSMSNASMTIAVDGKEYELHRLTLGDFADVCEAQKARNLEAFLNPTGSIKLIALPLEVRGAAIAEICTKPVSLHDCTVSYESRIDILWRALLRGDKTIRRDFVKNLPPIPLATLEELTLRIVGLWTDDAEAETDGPLEAPDSASMP